MQQIRVDALARIDSDSSSVILGLITGAFQRFPSVFEEEAMLRVGRLRFSGVKPKKEASNSSKSSSTASALTYPKHPACAYPRPRDEFSSEKKVIDSRPAHIFSQNFSMFLAPGNRRPSQSRLSHINWPCFAHPLTPETHSLLNSTTPSSTSTFKLTSLHTIAPPRSQFKHTPSQRTAAFINRAR